MYVRTYVPTYVLYHLRTYELGCSADFATRMYVRTYVVRTYCFTCCFHRDGRVGGEGRRVGWPSRGPLEGAAAGCVRLLDAWVSINFFDASRNIVMQGRRDLSQKVLFDVTHLLT